MSDRITIPLVDGGTPVALVDAQGGQVEGTLWGAARAGDAFALIVTADDHLAHTPTGPPTAGQARALADTLDNDPDNPHLTEGCRQWEKERARSLELQRDNLQRRLEAASDSASEWHQAYERVRGDLDRANARAGLLQQRVEVADRKLLTRQYGPGALKLAQAGVQHKERERARALVALARRKAHRDLVRGVAAAGLAGVASGLLIGRNR